MTTPNVLIVGATSAIAEAMARRWAERSANLYLLARNEARAEAMVEDLTVRGAGSVTTAPFDADELDSHDKLLDQAFTTMGPIDVVLIAHGTLPDQDQCEDDPSVALAALHTNAMSTASLVMLVANRLEAQQSGTLAVITSVAGDRGRRSNYVYGSAKAMVSTLLDGLRIRLAASGVHVVDIRPGFVDTPMTAELDKGLLWATPQAVANRAIKAVDGGQAVVYAPAFWAAIMRVVRSIPDPVFRRLPL
jgi:short-subunit dehydrogenase